MKDQELTLAGLTDDGTKLVLVGHEGTEFTLPVDDALRAALRGDHARTGQLERTMESTLRPRDIQARIRAGETPEAVASTTAILAGNAASGESDPSDQLGPLVAGRGNHANVTQIGRGNVSVIVQD